MGHQVLSGRVVADGKHLSLGGRPFRIRGVTYGTFRPRGDGEPFPETEQVRSDFREMARAGLGVARTYTLPPRDVLEVAAEVGLRLIIGLHYDDWRSEIPPGTRVRRRVLDAGRRAVAAAIERCGGRREVLAIAVGNEVPSDIVRVHGIGNVEETLSALVEEVHAGDPKVLATYVNYPSTEYLRIEGQDVVCFNVFLESPAQLRPYLRHLQVVAGEAPLVITELGLPSEVLGEEAQADSLEWQLRLVDESGTAGATVFSWTDDWVVDAEPVQGWGFGLTDAQRRPKPALEVARRWAGSGPRDLRPSWPKISVVVCAYNEERVLGSCLASLAALSYPDLEVIVCDDGSTDRTLEAARRFPFRILELPHGGLSRARNAGIAAATGSLVAFLDADATCHSEWPYHLALSLEEDNVVATGGPNLDSASTGLVERAVALSPGVPLQVLIADDRAEHVPGCNMAFSKDVLLAMDGFDPIFTAAGDDVDMCWRILDAGREIGFSPAAQVRHRRRGNIRSYLRQQRGYGRAERLLAGRHPHRFNGVGQPRWVGSIYGAHRFLPALLRPVVYHGPRGLAPYQSIVRARSKEVNFLLLGLLPLTLPVALVGALFALISPWALVVPALMGLLLLAYTAIVAAGVQTGRGEPSPIRVRALAALLHVAQPLVRAWARLTTRPPKPLPRQPADWTGDRAAWLEALKRDLAARGFGVRYGGEHDRWDLEFWTGPFLAGRVVTAVAWRWFPRYRLSFRFRIVALAALMGGLALIIVSLPLGSLVLGVVAAGALLERGLIKRTLARAMKETTMAQ